MKLSAPLSDPPDIASSHGLYRTTLAGSGRSLTDAFARIDHSTRVTRILRHPHRDLLSARVTLTPEEGRGYWELTRIRHDLHLILANYAYKAPRFEIVPGDDLVQFNFKVSGDLNYGVSRPGPLRFNRPSLHVWRQPRGIDMREWTAPGAHERMVAISVRPEFLAENFLPAHGDVPVRLQPFVAPARGRIDYCQLPLTAQMLQITTQLINPHYTAELYLLNTEALALQLLCAAVASLSSLPEQPAEEYSDRELAAFSAARQLLMEQLAPAPTLKKVARTVGLPEKTLTRGFKALYAETLFDFSLRCRMQHALTLLRDRHWSVDRASEAAGYSHPTSFTAAFRRHYGMRPIDVKRVKAGRNS